MSEPDKHPLPPVDNVYRPTFEDFLEHIRRGTLGELVADGHPTAIDRRPRTDGEIWLGPDGQPVSSFMRKFTNDFEGWQPGELVNAQFILSRREDGVPGLLVADACAGGDTRNADTFFLTEVSAEEGATLRTLGMALIDADVEVTGSGAHQLSNSYDYEARIHRINNVQMPWDGETEPQPGERILVQGEVVGYAPGKADYANAVFPGMLVRLPNGRVVPIEMTNGSINYSAGNMEVIYPEDIHEGDVVQINTTFSNASRQGDYQDRQPTFHAPFCRSAYLLSPSRERLAAYETHRADIAVRLAQLSSLEGQAFREAYSELMRAHIETGDEYRWPRLVMTAQELQIVRDIADQKFPDNSAGDPSPDKPITSFYSISSLAAVCEGYGVDVFGMTRQEFLEFCLDVANGRRLIDYGSGRSADDLVAVLEDGDFRDEERFLVYRQILAHWLPFMRGKEMVVSNQPPADPERQVNSRDNYLVKRSIQMLGSAATTLPAAREHLYELTIDTLREAVTEDTSGYTPRTRGLFVHDLCHTLQAALVGTAVYDEAQGWIAIKDPAGLDYFIGKMPELSNMALRLEAHDKEGNAARVVDLLTRIAQFNTLPPHAA